MKRVRGDGVVAKLVNWMVAWETLVRMCELRENVTDIRTRTGKFRNSNADGL